MGWGTGDRTEDGDGGWGTGWGQGRALCHVPTLCSPETGVFPLLPPDCLPTAPSIPFFHTEEVTALPLAVRATGSESGGRGAMWPGGL